MLYRLEIENFYSVRDLQVLDLRVGKRVPEAPERFGELFPGSHDRVAKAIALFGPNGSGKSSVLRALSFISWFVRGSFQHSGPALPCERFNDEESANRPIRLAIELGGLTDLGKRQAEPQDRESSSVGTFRYELHLQPIDGLVKTVIHESLRVKPNGQGKWQRVFERDARRIVQGSKIFPLGGFSRVADKIRENASVIGTLALFEHQASKDIIDVANAIQSNILVDRTDPGDEAVVQYLLRNPHVVSALNHELQRIDLGVEEMKIVQAATGPLALFKHQGLHMEMPWGLESHGTRSFIRIFPQILQALNSGGIAVIDELDQSIHPVILPEIVRWFYDPQRNPFDAQLWMTCHSASLLDEVHKEEVVLCEKDSQGRSRFYSLMDVSAVRRTENLYKKYLGGVYGALPRIG